MAATTLPHEDRVGLLGSIAAHVVLVLLLVVGLPLMRAPPVPERISVTIADETADTSTSPKAFEEAAPAVAPDAGEAPPEAVEPPLPEPLPRVAPSPEPPPQPQPRASAAPQPRQQAAAPQARPAPSPRQPNRRPGGSRVGPDFLPGNPAGTRPSAQGNPAQAIGEQAKATVRQTIAAEVLPYWNHCAVDGVDIEKLSVRIVIHMDPKGNVTSMDAPEVSGRTEANATQVGRFAECAQSAIRQASPFALSADAYDFWKTYPVRLRKQRER